jgi:hypothetical protein
MSDRLVPASRPLGHPLQVVLAAALLVSCEPRCGSVPPDEAVQTLLDGDRRLLRDPPRPIRGERRVVVLALDGIGQDAFAEALAGGAMPHVRALFGASLGDGRFENGFIARGVTTVLPSITLSAWTSTMTGLPPAETGVPGNEWFDRELGAFFAPGGLSVTDRRHTLEALNDGLVGEHVAAPTVFERLDVRVHVSMLPIYRGADVFTVSDAVEPMNLLTVLIRGVGGGEGISREAYQELDSGSVESLVAAFPEEGLPDLQVAYFGGLDLYTHESPDPLVAQQRMLAELVDPALATLLEEYRRRGALAQTVFVFVSDHGHTPVRDDGAQALGMPRDEAVPAWLEGLGFRTRPSVLQTAEDEADFQLVAAYQGPMVFLYVADRSTCPRPGERCDWSRPPRYEQDVLPLLRALEARRAANEPPFAFIDLLLSREPVPVAEPAAPFSVFDGEGLVSVRDYLARVPRPELLAFEERLGWLSAGRLGHRAGDVALLTDFGAHRPVEERRYFGPRYHSMHGGAAELDSLVTLAVAGAPGSGEALGELVRRTLSADLPSLLDVAALLEALLAAGS